MEQKRRAWVYRLAAIFGILALVITVVFEPIAVALVLGVARAAGFSLTYDSLAIRLDELQAKNLIVATTRGEPVAQIASLDLRYSIPQALERKRVYGLQSFALDRPHLTLIRHRDGSWNVPFSKAQGGPPSATPMIFDGSIRDGSIDVYDGAQGTPSARHLQFRGLEANVRVATNARTAYRVRLGYLQSGTTYQIAGSGVMDLLAGYGMQRWTIPKLPIDRLTDVALNSPSFHMLGGSLRNADLRIDGLGDGHGALDEHLSAVATLDRARIAVGGLRAPLRNVHGGLALYGDGLLLQSIVATLGGMPVRIDGAIFRLSDPDLRLTVAGTGNLATLRKALSLTAAPPVSGFAGLHVLIEGHPSAPLMIASADSARIASGRFAATGTHVAAAYDGSIASILNAQTQYGNARAVARGSVALHSGPRALEVVTTLDAPSAAVPYANLLIPDMPLHASVLATSDTLRTVAARGIFVGRSSSAGLAGTFDLNSSGVGTVGPVRVTRPGNASLEVMAYVDRPHQHLDALAQASHLRVVLPQLGATIDGRVAGTYERGVLSAGGWTHVTNVHTPYANVAQIQARFGNTARHGIGVALAASGIGSYNAAATAMLDYHNGTVSLQNATASARGTLLDAHGTVAGIADGAPRYDINAQMQSADLSSLVAVAQPRAARLVEGSGDANLVVRGSGRAARINGTLHAPEGAVNGLPFHGLDASISGSSSSLRIARGSVGVGTTTVGFSGGFSRAATTLHVRAPHAELEDFNDFFDAGDMLYGDGSIAADASMRGRAIASSGHVALTDAHVRSFDIGTAQADWRTNHGRVGLTLAFGGPSGTVRANGTIGTDGDIAGLTVRARHVDVGQWLAMGGYAMPVTGIADADAHVSGRFPALHATLKADARDGVVQHVTVQRVDLTASLDGTRATMQHFNLQIPSGTVTGAGRFGLRANDPIALAFNATTPDVGALGRTLTGRALDAAGSVTTSLRVSGTRTNPSIDDRFTARQLRFKRFVAPYAAGELQGTPRLVALRNAQLDLTRGRLRANAAIPIQFAQGRIDSTDRPISADLVADDVELPDFVSLLPQGTTLRGRIDGHISAHGTTASPQLLGMLTLADGYYSGPQETLPIERIGAQVAFAGTTATLQQAHATVGGGNVDASGRVSIPDMRDARRVSMQLRATAQNATIDAPAYVKGRFDGQVSVTKLPGSRPSVTGTVVTPYARIPLTALYNPKPANAPNITPPDIGLGLHIEAGRDVRVQSPNVDVGATGAVDVDGTLASPALNGTFHTTGGTVSFYRTFQVESGRVTFDPSSGIIPYVNAVATTTIDNPPTDIALRVSGPATDLNIAFASNPSYNRSQILGLLVNAQSLGAVQGVATTGSSSFSASNAVSQLAQGQLNQFFTRNLLEPFSVAAGGALGLQNFQITSSLQSGLGVNAVKTFGKMMRLVYAQTFGLPRRQSIALQARPAATTEYSLSVFTTQGQNIFALEQPNPLGSLQEGIGNVNELPMDTGTNGVSLKVMKKFPRKFP